MTSWNDAHHHAPELADAVRGRFEDHGLGLLATVRRDGFPRISGVEPLFDAGELWLGMMPGSRKGADLRRDPRLTLHSATTDKNVAKGDAKVTGRAVLVTEPDRIAAFVQAFAAATGYEVPGPFDLFVVDVTELAMVRPGDDHLVIDSWRVGEAPRRVERR